MAYVVQKPKQDQMQSGPQAAPTLSGGSPMAQPIAKSAAATDSGGAAKPMMQPQAQSPGMQPMQNAGRSGRFTNLQTILGQNQGLGAQISKAGQTQLGAAKTAFNTAAQPLRDANFTANTNWQNPFQNIGYAGESGFRSERTGTIANPSFQKLSEMLNQQYTGPGVMSFDFQGNKNLQNAAALGDATTAGAQLAVGPYSGSASRLDQAMLGGSGEARGAMKALNSERRGFVNAAGDEQGKLNDKVTGFSKAAEDARNTVREGLSGAGQTMLSDLRGRVKAANDQEVRDYTGGIVRDPVTGQVYSLAGNEQINGWSGPEAGEGANVGNMVSTNEASRFAALRDLLGASQYDINRTGQYQSGYNTYGQFDPELVVTTSQGKHNTNDASDPETQRQLDTIEKKKQEELKRLRGY